MGCDASGSTDDRATRHLLYVSVLTLVLALGLPARASAAAPTADLTASPQVQTIGAPVSVTATNATDPDGTAVTVGWTFGDGSSASGASARRAYATRGTKTITMTLTDGNGETASVEHSVRINAPPVAAFTWTPSIRRSTRGSASTGHRPPTLRAPSAASCGTWATAAPARRRARRTPTTLPGTRP